MIRFLLAIREYLMLPSRISKFEHGYLTRLNRTATIIFALHLPLFIAIAYFNQTGPLLAAVLTTATVAGPLLALRFFESQRAISVVHGFTMVLMCGLLIHFGQGPVQIEMHFYYFVGLTVLTVFGNPMVILAATVTIAVHHIGLYIFLPSSAWNYEASVWVLLTHILFAVLAAASGAFNSRTFFDSFAQLEQKVTEQSKKVGARNRDIGLILSSVEEGFLTMGRDGVILDERSAAVDRLLGKIEEGQTLVSALSRHDAKFASWLEFGLDEVFDGVLPAEVAVDQLPSEMNAMGRVLSLRYYPLLVDDSVSSIKVIVTDVTTQMEKQKLEADTREMLALIDKYSSDPTGLLEFFQESEKIIDQLRNESRDDLVLVKRRLHTLKGNASMFGLLRLAETCHALEDRIFELQACPDDVKWTDFFGCWASARGHMRRISNSETNGFRVAEEEHRELLQSLLRHDSPETLAMRVASWRLEPTEYRLQRFATQARHLAKRMGKGDIHINIESNAIRLESEHWTDFWGSLVHVIRNAIDHGLESIEERRLSRKPSHGRLALSTFREQDQFVVSVADDGKGIDWDRIAEFAKDRRLPAETIADLTNALFIDGVSSASKVTSYSGRGVGMSALKQSCDALGGEIQVISREGEGTTFRFVFPASAMAPDLSRLFAAHGSAVDMESIITSTPSTRY